MSKFDYYQASLSLKVLKMFTEMFPELTLNILVSFAMIENDILDFLGGYRDKFGKIILDSGTWSLNKSKDADTSGITLLRYKDYLSAFGDLFNFYFNFDSDFTDNGFHTNRYNQEYLERHELNPIWVVHNIYNNEFQYCIDRGFKLIALGSTQITSQKIMAHVTRILDGTGIKVHTLGKSGWDLLAYFPISSSDSAMWARGGGYGFIYYWNPRRQGEDKTDRIYLEEYLNPNCTHKNSYYSYEFKEDFDAYLLNTFNLKYYDFFGKGAAYNKMLVNTYYYVQLEKEINKMHQHFGF